MFHLKFWNNSDLNINCHSKDIDTLEIVSSINNHLKEILMSNQTHSDIQNINPTHVMSAATVFNKVVYLSGQVPKNTDADITGQTQDILATIDQLLAEANTDKSRLLSAHIYIKNLSDFQTFNTVWIDWIKDSVPPARATIQADLVNPDWLIEIAVTAAQR